MGKHKSKDAHHDLFLADGTTEEVDLEDLIATIHSSETWEPSRPRRRGRGHRSARHRLDELAQERALRDALVDWDDYDEFEDHVSG